MNVTDPALILNTPVGDTSVGAAGGVMVTIDPDVSHALEPVSLTFRTLIMTVPPLVFATKDVTGEPSTVELALHVAPPSYDACHSTEVETTDVFVRVTFTLVASDRSKLIADGADGAIVIDAVGEYAP